MIYINDQLSIPDDEITITASRSGGPGGQNVNKVSSRVTLWFDVGTSALLSVEQRRRIETKLATRINKDGKLRIVSQRSRSQEMNRADAIQRFAELLRVALAVRTPRIRTKLPRQAKERRLGEKRKRTQLKQERSQKEWD
jgi:ribosome-associated protein